MRQLSLNEKRLIELVASGGAVARVDLARLSGMTGASVTRLISGLLDLGILAEETDRQGRAGQPKRLLSLAGGSYYSAGLIFSLRRMEIAILDLTGRLAATRSIDIVDQSAAGVAEAARAAIHDMRARHRIGRDRLVGVGCALPGNFGTFEKDLKAHELFSDFDEGRTFKAFTDVFEMPFHFENDGSAAALGEHVFGRLEDDGPSMFFIHIGHGVGGGAVIDGRLFRGVHGNACLPGVLFPYAAPRPSGQDLINCLAAGGIELEDFDHLDRVGEKGEALIDDWVGRAGVQLRDAVRAVSGFFDPSVIVIGGRLPKWLNERLVEAILADPIDGPSRGLVVAPVRASSFGPEVGAVGAACIPMFESFFGGSRSDAGNPYLNGRRPQPN